MSGIKYRALCACFAAALFSFYNIFQLSLINCTAAAISFTFHLSSLEIGLLSSAYLWANAIGLIPIGIFIDRFGTRAIAIILLLLSIGSGIVISITHHWQIIIFLRFIQGLASAGSLLTCMRTGIQWFPKKANTAIGMMISIALLGGMVGNDVFPHVVNVFGWQNSFLIATAIGTLILLFQYFFLREKDLSLRNSSYTLQSAFSNYQNLILGIYLGLMSLPIFIFAASWGHIWLRLTYHLSSTQAGMTGGLIFLGLLFGSPFIGVIADKLKNPQLIIQTGACSALSIILILFLNIDKSFISVNLLFFILGIACSSQNVIYILLAEINSKKNISTATGIAALLENSIGALGQIIFGWLLNFSWEDMEISDLTSKSKHILMSTILFFIIAFLMCILLGFIYKFNQSNLSSSSKNHLSAAVKKAVT